MDELVIEIRGYSLNVLSMVWTSAFGPLTHFLVPPRTWPYPFSFSVSTYPESGNHWISALMVIHDHHEQCDLPSPALLVLALN